MTWHSPTPEQEAAIVARNRDIFCEAGAGSGKTRVLTDRYCDAVTIDGVGIEAILAFTFTERAAAELRHRIRREFARRSELAKASGDSGLARELRTLARDTERAWVTTIHGFCRRLLAQHPIAAGLDPRFRVIDAAEATRLLGRCAQQTLDDAIAGGDEAAARVAASFQGWRIVEMLQTAYEIRRGQGMSRPSLPDVGPPITYSDSGDEEPLDADVAAAALEAKSTLDLLLGGLAERYEAAKAARSGLDFADLELKTIELLGHSEAVRAIWRGRFTHLMVDEFQDTNGVQLAIVEALRDEGTALFTVGDENQSIYRFRGADLEVFRRQRAIAQDSPGVDVLGLRGNFRSDPAILSAANCLGTTLLPQFEALTAGRTAAGGEPRVELLLSLDEGRGRDHRKWKDHEETLEAGVVGSPSVVAKARALAERLRELVDDGEAEAGDIVILLRAFTHVDAYRDALERFGLDPYVVGGRGYWSQQQVEDLLRPLAVIANPLDDEMLFGALAGPGCQASPDTLWLLRQAAGRGRHVWPVLDQAFGTGEDGFDPEDPEAIAHIGDEQASRLRAFVAQIRALRAEAPLLALDTLVERVMVAFDHDLALLARDGAEGRMANVRKLMRLAGDFERDEGRDLRGFLAQAFAATATDEREGLAPVQAEEHDGVRLMTIHGAKGLEFPVVCVPDLDRGLATGGRSSDLLTGRPGQEGEKRLGIRLPFPTTPSIRLWDLDELIAAEKGADAEESLRLVYVAVTRAQERLILTGTYKPADLERSEPTTNQTTLARWLPELVELGWDGAEGEVTLLPADPATPDIVAAPPAKLVVRISEPGEARAAALAVRRDPSPRPSASKGRKTLPILSGRPSPVPLGHLSYSALDAYSSCGYRFYIERVLGVGTGMLSATAPAGKDPEAPEPRATSPARALGNAVHGALEWSARNAWESPGQDRIEALLAHDGANDPDLVARAHDLVQAWLGSELCAALGGLELRAEAPFVLPIAGTVLRGNIDLLATGGDGPLVIDFKTDRLNGKPTASLGERYSSQRAIYALAAAGQAASTPIRAAHVFLESPGDPVIESFAGADLDAARTRIEELVERIRSGSFEPTPDPYEALCLGCPAAARLCPHPKWRPDRKAAVAIR